MSFQHGLSLESVVTLVDDAFEGFVTRVLQHMPVQPAAFLRSDPVHFASFPKADVRLVLLLLLCLCRGGGRGTERVARVCETGR